MSASVTVTNAHRISLASEFFMARRPILNRESGLAGHELMFCSTDTDDTHIHVHAPSEEAGSSASVIADVCSHGLGRVIGEVPAYMQMDASALMSDIFRFLPRQMVVPVISSHVMPTEPIMQRLRGLVHAGFALALEVKEETEQVHALLPMVKTVKIDLAGKMLGEAVELASRFKAHHKKLLAESVETVDQFEATHAAGFDYFQGYYFTKPQIVAGNKLFVSHAAIMTLMTLLSSDADTSEIENSIKSDVALGLRLLQLVNTPSVSVHQIDSLRQALMILGRDQLQRWLQVLLYSEPHYNRQGMKPLQMLALTRGRLMELVAQRNRPSNRSIADTAFTVGSMSLLNTLFSMPMDEIIEQLTVTDEVRDALLFHKGYYGDLLRLAEYTEWTEKSDTLLLHALKQQRLSCSELYMLQLAAFEWSDHITHGMS